MPISARDVVDRQNRAYNARDLESIMSCYAPDCRQVPLRENGGTVVDGFAAIRERYRAIFAAAPALHAQVHDSIELDRIVAQSVTVTGLRPDVGIDAITVYIVDDGLISKVLYAMLDRPL